uniref:BAR domain-containing protein n=1 Tax=Canis lupus dingo TaxID=286419 RepID=A0A8C0KTP1_CANLU
MVGHEQWQGPAQPSCPAPPQPLQAPVATPTPIAVHIHVSSHTLSVGSAQAEEVIPQSHSEVSEKFGGIEGTKLDDDFKEMERKVGVTIRSVMEIIIKTTEYLQANPASRAK